VVQRIVEESSIFTLAIPSLHKVLKFAIINLRGRLLTYPFMFTLAGKT